MPVHEVGGGWWSLSGAGCQDLHIMPRQARMAPARRLHANDLPMLVSLKIRQNLIILVETSSNR